MRLTIKVAEERVGSLSVPSKMPGFSYSTPAEDCITGSKLVDVVNSICSFCYARKGRYVFSNVKTAQKKRLKSLDQVDWVDMMVFMIGKREKSGFFRWHDAGDVQGVWHLEKIAEVARRLPHIKFWLPTREYSFVREWRDLGRKPDNLIIRLSAYMMDGEPPTKLARRLGLTTSGAKTDNSFTCPAPKQGNECGSCRSCWDEDVENIDYKKH